MPGFELTFRVPPHHSLEQVKMRSRAGDVMEMHWEHREYGADGHLVARYESYQILDSAHRGQCNGWRKYDHKGHLLDQGGFTLSANRNSPLDEV